MLYIQTCVIGLAILIIPLLNHHRTHGRDWVLYRAVLYTTMLDLVFETAGWLLNGQVFPGGTVWVYLVNLFTLIPQSLLGLLWLYYVLEKINYRLSKRATVLFLMPLILDVAMLLANYWTHLVFVISPENVYMRGPYLYAHVAISLMYAICATIFALSFAYRSNYSPQRRERVILSAFLLPPIIGTIVQMIFYGTFLVQIGIAISLLIVFINIQNEQITVDFLTRVNNRASFISYAERKIQALKPDSLLYLFMIDVDSFKQINDTYGHIVGDQVLLGVADQLKKACAGQSCFLARLGGDEYSILFECDCPDEVSVFVGRIHKAIDAFNKASNLSCIVTLSIGYTLCDDSQCSVDTFITRADTMMYSQKKRRQLRSCPE